MVGKAGRDLGAALLFLAATSLGKVDANFFVPLLARMHSQRRLCDVGAGDNLPFEGKDKDIFDIYLRELYEYFNIDGNDKEANAAWQTNMSNRWED